MELDVKNLSIERGETLIIDRLSFSLASGQGLEIRGENGSGKTTLLRAIAGLLPKTSGEILFKKNNRPCQPFQLTKACHYLGDQNAMKQGLSVDENLQFWQEFYGSPQYSIDEALEKIGLLKAAFVPFEHLSKGQKRRVSLARLLISHRPIWVLDEPTSGLDAESDALFNDILANHLQTGGMALIASHLPLDHPLKILKLGA